MVHEEGNRNNYEEHLLRILWLEKHSPPYNTIRRGTGFFFCEVLTFCRAGTRSSETVSDWLNVTEQCVCWY